MFSSSFSLCSSCSSVYNPRWPSRTPVRAPVFLPLGIKYRALRLPRAVTMGYDVHYPRFVELELELERSLSANFLSPLFPGGTLHLDLLIDLHLPGDRGLERRVNADAHSPSASHPVRYALSEQDRTVFSGWVAVAPLLLSPLVGLFFGFVALQTKHETGCGDGTTLIRLGSHLAAPFSGRLTGLVVCAHELV